MATAQPTTDPNEIRQWVEARGGHPARVKQTGSRKDPGVLRIDFPGFSGEDTLEEIEWDEFFEWFNRNRLAMLLSDEEGNRFNKLVSRSTVKASAKKSSARKSSAKKSSTRKSSAKKSSASTKKAAPAKRASSRKATSAKKSSAKKSSAKKSSAKKSSAKKSSASTKRPSSRKASSTKKAASSRKAASSKKAPAKKASARKSSAKKLSPARRVVARTPARKASAKKAGSSTTTTNHAEIRKWVESRGGFPAHVKQTGRKRGDLGVLRIDYPGYSGRDTLERIEWEQWLDAFDRNKLAFLYQNKRGSRFSKLVNR